MVKIRILFLSIIFILTINTNQMKTQQPNQQPKERAMNQREGQQEERTMNRQGERTMAFFRQQGVYLRFKMTLAPSEVAGFIKKQQNFVVVSTNMNPRCIPELLHLNKEKIFKEGFSIEVDGVLDHLWRDKKSGGVH